MNDFIGAVRQYRTTRKIKKLFNAAAKGDAQKLKSILASGFDFAGYKHQKIGGFGTENYLLGAVNEAARHGQPAIAEILIPELLGDTASYKLPDYIKNVELMHRMSHLSMQYGMSKQTQEYEATLKAFDALLGKSGVTSGFSSRKEDLIPGDPKGIFETAKVFKRYAASLQQSANNQYAPPPVTDEEPAQTPPPVNTGRLVVQELTAPHANDIAAPTRATFAKRKRLQA